MREIIIDGRQGEGGGQILRSALSLSAITGKPFRIEGLRGGRQKPGLLRQHLTALRAAAKICGAKVEGAELGSTEVAFKPGHIRAGDYEFSIGTAGATTLVAQTVLPILVHASAASRVKIKGGTHNRWAPTFDFLQHAFMPQFRKMGGQASLSLEAYGFYPAGGGAIELDVQPTDESSPLKLESRGGRLEERIEIVISNLKRSIAERELNKLLKTRNLPSEQGEIVYAESPGPGNVVTSFVKHENVTEVFVGLGEYGVRAETVAKRLADEVQRFSTAYDSLNSFQPAVGEYLADQLLMPMALFKGGVFTTTDITEHFRTNAEIIKRFVSVQIKPTQVGRKCWKVVVKTDS